MAVPRTYTKYELDDAVAQARTEAYKAAYDKSHAESFALGSKAQRERLGAILFGPDAEGREAAAQALAFDGGGISVQAAIEILKGLPRTPKQTPPRNRARYAAGGLVIDGEAELDPKGAFEAGRAIAESLRR